MKVKRFIGKVVNWEWKKNSVSGNPCNDPIVIRLANRFHRADECGKIEAKEGGEE